tara:strand:+ start:252 stop:584 length:333 start_codon:yes stop_codon:yes gene_type:complete
MKLYQALKKANEEGDHEKIMSFYHENFEFIRHQTGTTVNKAEFSKFVAEGNSKSTSKMAMARCIYENDDIMVDHSVMRFPDGSRESIIRVRMIEDGKIIRMETGATQMST